MVDFWELNLVAVFMKSNNHLIRIRSLNLANKSIFNVKVLPGGAF